MFRKHTTDERWHEVVGRVKDTFKVLEEGKNELLDMPGHSEFICFLGPGNKKMKLERVSHPLVTGKKTIGSRRIGGTSTVEYQYSDTETVHKIHAWQWDEAGQTWQEIKAEAFNF